MYAKRLIEAKFQAFRTNNYWEPVYHDIAQIKEFSAYINAITKSEPNSRNSYITFTRRLSEQRLKEIKRWIENEQVLCSIDSDYWETRYAYICDEKGEIFQFRNRVSQQIFDMVVAHFEDLEVAIELFILKARQLGMCLSPKTRILTADLEWVSLENIAVGQELVACEEGPINVPWKDLQQRRRGGDLSHRSDRKMNTCVVQAKWDVQDFAVKLTFDDGRILETTPDHRLLFKQHGGVQPLWKSVKESCVGDYVRYVTKPWGSSDYEDGWFGGLLDGEGSLRPKDRAGVEACVSQIPGAVLDRAASYLSSRSYTFRVDVDDRVNGTSSKLGNNPVHKLIIGRMDELFRLIGQTRPSRFIRNRWWGGKSLPGRNSGIGWAKVISVELLTERRMIDLQTSTKTFIAEGFVSHNSTKVALKFLHRLLFMGHTQAVMASVQADKSELIGRILTICYERCPWWLIPQRTTERVGKMMGFSNGSILSIQSGMQATGIAQGWTPTCVHISEIGDVPNPKKSIEEGLLRATHPTRKMFQVHEGTGNGNTGWQADTWRTLKEDWPLGRARFCPLFLSWPLATDLYPEADWLRKFPIPEGWQSCEDTRKHVRKCELYIRTAPFLRDICGTDYTMPRHQQWFWEFNYLAAVKSRTQRIWLSQMPADDYEALTGKNDLVFERDVIEVKTQERERKYKVYAIVGKPIDDGFEPDTESIDYDAERIRVTWLSHRGNRYEWTLIPLLPFVDENNERESFDKLLVFEPPKEGRDYSIGIDTADGLDKEEEDRTCINVTANAKGNFPDIQVAEFTSRRINPAQAVGFAAALGAWYGPVCRDPRGVKFCIEQRERPGDDCQHQLKLMGFTYHHVMIRYDGKVVKESHGQKQGWYTGSWSRSIITTRFVDAVNNGWYKPNSKWLIAELADFERKISATGKTRLEHQSGKHDDRIWASALSYITKHHMDVLTERSTKVYTVKTGKQPDVTLEYSRLNQLSIGD